MTPFDFHGKDILLPGYFQQPNHTRATVLVIHGMTEHSGRYEVLAEALNRHGIALAVYDLRGHGQHPGDPACAAMEEGDWGRSIEDIGRVMEQLLSMLPNRPLYLTGFSLGSFLVREYMNNPRVIPDGVILLGTGHQPKAVLTIMKAIVKTQIRKAGYTKTTPLVRKLSFGTYNQKFRPNRTSCDWLCSDSAELDKYLRDPLCRPDISAGLFYALLGSMGRTRFDRWPKDVPVLVLSGDRDPVGDNYRGIETLVRQMKQAGLSVYARAFPGARHDLLHEESSGNAELARQTLLNWLESHL